MIIIKPKHIIFLLLTFLPIANTFSTPPELLLAKTYAKSKKQINIQHYFISEKYDGVRALWDGKQLLSRQGNVYHAPDWFLADFPNQPLDGELWIARGRFEEVVSTVRKKQPIDTEWKKVRYMVFELPNGKGTFSQRLITLKSLLTDGSQYIELVEQFRLDDHQALINKLKVVTQQGAEGLMMHLADALYETGRSDVLLKVKQYQDAEATVIEHMPGKGKFQDMLGALLLENENGQRFKVGSGFSNRERANPPPIGSIITYKYYGLTKNKIPRFASFLRIRQ